MCKMQRTVSRVWLWHSAVDVFCNAAACCLPTPVYGLFMLSMLIDWGLQAADVLPSTNVRRFVSGVLCGIAVIGIFHALLQAIF